MHHNTVTIVLSILLLVTNAIWITKYSIQRSNLIETQRTELRNSEQGKKVAIFQKLFVNKVLMSDGNVDFDTRVELQNAVTAVGDESISKTWSDFLAAKTEADAQKKVKELLSLLVNKIDSN